MENLQIKGKRNSTSFNIHNDISVSKHEKKKQQNLSLRQNRKNNAENYL